METAPVERLPRRRRPLNLMTYYYTILYYQILVIAGNQFFVPNKALNAHCQKLLSTCPAACLGTPWATGRRRGPCRTWPCRAPRAPAAPSAASAALGSARTPRSPTCRCGPCPPAAGSAAAPTERKIEKSEVEEQIYTRFM